MTKTVNTYIRESPCFGSDVYAACVMKVAVGDESDDYARSVDNNIRVGIGTEGFLTIEDSDTHHQVFFYSDQLEDLKMIVEKAIAQRDANAESYK